MGKKTSFGLLQKWFYVGVIHGLVFICLLVSKTFGQDPYLQKGNRAIRQEAVKITAQYQPRLVMGVEQALQFRKKVAEFLIRKKAVMETDFSPKKKMFYLEQLSAQETSEMADVLESYGMQEYVRLKREIQPLPDLETNLRDSILQ